MTATRAIAVCTAVCGMRRRRVDWPELTGRGNAHCEATGRGGRERQRRGEERRAAVGAA